MSAVDEVELETIVGPQNFLANGARIPNLRAGANGELITGYAHGKYHEAVSRGRVFYACNQTAATFGTALTATIATVCISNPVGSPVNLSLLHVGATILTGGTGGHLVYAAGLYSATAVIHTTPLTTRNAKLAGAAGIAFADTVATLPAAPVAIRTLGAVITAASTNAISDYVDGLIIVDPGTSISIQGITVVGTGLISMCWEEVPNQ